MNKNNIIILVVAVLLIIGAAVAYYLNETGGLNGEKLNITDMANRTVSVPAAPNKILSTSPSATMLVFMLAPEKLQAFNFQMTDEEKVYLASQYQNLPSVGGWFGSQTGNYEEFTAMEPDIILESITTTVNQSAHGSTLETLNERQTKFGEIPVVAVLDTSDFETINPSILFLGKILGANEKAQKLVDYNNRVQKEVTNVVKTIPDSEKVTVYYAEGTDGLATEPSGSAHSKLIDYCGGINVANVEQQGGSGKTPVSMEQVIAWNPDVIITTDPTFYKSVYSSENWKSISAVKNKRVYLSPQSPFKWFDRPTAANMIIGIPWTAKVLYPDKFTTDSLKSDVKEFYSEFYHYDLSDDQINTILKDSGLTI